MTVRGWKKSALLAIGWLCVGLAFAAIVVPGVPTTSFLILAAWCFFRSSEKAHRWLLENRVLGPYIRDYLSGAGMPRKAKVIAISMMWVMCSLSAAFLIPNVWIKAVVFLCAPLGTYFVLRVPTKVEGETE